MCLVEPGQQLDHYSIDSVLAHSGMATVFCGTDRRNGRQVVIKVPHMEAESDIVFFDRFRREMEIGRKLDHPGVAKAFYDCDRSRIYIVMERAEGKMLRTLLSEQGKLPAERAIGIARQICDVLEYIHGQGVVHRDLKPENIIIDANDRIKLIDFGIASNAGSRRLTFGKFSNVIGSPDYISPEQLKGKRGDARSDVYALGVMLYEMLTGRAPFDGPNALAAMNSRLVNDPVPPRTIDAAISPQLEKVVIHAMKREPESRYASAKEMAHELTHLDEVSVDADPVAAQAVRQKMSWTREVLPYASVALLPLLMFTLMFMLTNHA